MSASTSNPSASKSARGNTNGVDRLSSLCDEVLHQVMSFLQMPEVMRTSLLSLRWRNLWSSMPFIHIDYQDFKDKNNFSCVDDDKMEKFGDNLLLLRDGTVCLDEARISVTRGSIRKSSVWIRHAIKHKVRLLHVSGFDDYPILDSTAMFPSKHIKIIRLRALILSYGFFKLLNYDCPVLEHLELEDCSLSDLKEISSMSLKVLLIIRCLILKGLQICASNLTHLSILGPVCHSGAVATRDLSSLVAASISLSVQFHGRSHTIGDHRLLGGLSHATTLELHAPLPELAFERGLQTYPAFSNLTSLVLGDWCMAADLYPLLHILHCSPKLKELSFMLKMVHCEPCKKAESASIPTRRAPSTRGYPCIERINIYCSKDDPKSWRVLSRSGDRVELDWAIAELRGLDARLRSQTTQSV